MRAFSFGRTLLAASLAVLAAGCAPDSSDPRTGTAEGGWDCEVFLPGSSPPNMGDGAVTVELGGEERLLAQSASAFAIDAAGLQTLDPDAAAYFAVQVFQYVSEDELEIFEVRVLPADWTDGVEVPFDGVRALGFFGTVTFDAYGNATDAVVEATTTGGRLLLETAGRDPRAPVRGTLVDVTLSTE